MSRGGEAGEAAKGQQGMGREKGEEGCPELECKVRGQRHVTQGSLCLKKKGEGWVYYIVKGQRHESLRSVCLKRKEEGWVSCMVQG